VDRNGIVPTGILKLLHPPLPTHAFWANWHLAYPWLHTLGDAPVVTLPYAIKCIDGGIFISYPPAHRIVTGESVSDYFKHDLGFSTVEQYETRYVSDYDFFTATMVYEVSQHGFFKVIAVRGSPYVTVLYNSSTPVISSPWSDLLSINGKPLSKGQLSGTEFIIEQKSGLRWILFASDTVNFKIDPKTQTLTALSLFQGTIRAAKSADAQTDQLFRMYSETFPVGGDFSYEVQGDTVTYHYNWVSEGNGDLLMGSVKHLSDIMAKGTKFIERGVLDSMKGPVDFIAGNSWTLTEKLPTITWYAPRKITDDVKISQLIAQLRLDVIKDAPDWPDPYFSGKEFARLARIVLIAEEYDAPDVIETGMTMMKQFMEQWLDGTNGDKLIYETNWGGITTHNGLGDFDDDFGNGWYNDHHFHYGYFLYALAVMIKIEPSYYDAHRAAIDLLIGDIGNMDPKSELFPVARHKDFYDHHSWAQGLYSDWCGKNQESSSEAVNAYYGMWLLGIAIKDNELADWGRVLLAMELRGAHYYWQMLPGNEDIYDYYFSANKMVGQVGLLVASYKTWFGNNTEYIHGIQMIPFTPMTEELLPYEYVLAQWPVAKTALTRETPPVEKSWAAILYLDYAILDPVDAWNFYSDIDQSHLDNGFSKSNAMYWILTRESRGPYVDNSFPPEQKVLPSCLANTGCRNSGEMLGSCCPSTDGFFQSCCPTAYTKTSNMEIYPNQTRRLLRHELGFD